MSSETQTENIPMKEFNSKTQQNGYTNTPDYNKNFLEVVAQSVINNKLIYPNTHDIDRQLIHFKVEEIEDASLPAHTLCGFFKQLHKFNGYAELKDDEYFIGLYGNVNSNYFKMDDMTSPTCVLSVKKLFLISNYLNVYSVVTQYDLTPQNLNKTFEERYRLWPQKQNNILLFDSQIDSISSCFQHLNVELTNMDLCRQPNSILHYGKTKFNSDSVDDYMLKIFTQNFTGFNRDMLKLLSVHDNEWKNMEKHLLKVDQELIDKEEVVSSLNQKIQALECKNKTWQIQLENKSKEFQETLQKHLDKETKMKESVILLQKNFKEFQSDFERQKKELLDYRNKFLESSQDASKVQSYVTQLDIKNKNLVSWVTYYKCANWVSWGILASLVLAWYL